MFHIQASKTKLYVRGVYGSRMEWINDINRSVVFSSPQEAQNYIDFHCSVTSRSHVVFYDGSSVWNVIKQGFTS